jgi:hypothetical protein
MRTLVVFAAWVCLISMLAVTAPGCSGSKSTEPARVIGTTTGGTSSATALGFDSVDPIGLTDSIPITAHAVDSLGNEVPDGTTINFTFAPGDQIKAKLSAASAQTVNGKATVTLTSMTNADATVTVNATCGIAKGSLSITIKAPAMSGTVDLVPTKFTVAVKDNSILTATVLDQSNNPVNNVIVNFSLSDDKIGVLSKTDVPTDSSGKATTTFTGSARGSVNINASVPSQPDITTKSITLQVTEATLAIANAALNSGDVGLVYFDQIFATGGSGNYISYLVTNGTLPPGLAMDPASGQISGIPTVGGIYQFVVMVTDDSGGTTYPPPNLPRVFSITIRGSLKSGNVGAFYDEPILFTGGTGTYTPPYSLVSGMGELPPGLDLGGISGPGSCQEGYICGIATTSGIYEFTLQVTDDSGAVQTMARSITINATALTITTLPALPPGQVGYMYNYTLLASGGDGNYTWGIGSGFIPGGSELTIGEHTGKISSTTAGPQTPGTYNFTVTLSDGSGNHTSQVFQLTINP